MTPSDEDNVSRLATMIFLRVLKTRGNLPKKPPARYNEIKKPNGCSLASEAPL